MDPAELDILQAEGVISQQPAFDIEATMQYNAITGMAFMPTEYSEEASQNMNLQLYNHQPMMQQPPQQQQQYNNYNYMLQQQQYSSHQQQPAQQPFIQRQGALNPMMLQNPMTCSVPVFTL